MKDVEAGSFRVDVANKLNWKSNLYMQYSFEIG